MTPQISFGWTMHEVHTPDEVVPGTLSAVGSFCLHYGISAPVAILRYSNAADARATCADRWRMKAESLLGAGQPRHASPTFSSDVASVAASVIQVACALLSEGVHVLACDICASSWMLSVAFCCSVQVRMLRQTG